MRFVVALLAVGMFWMSAHWTQRFVNVQVVTASACVPGLPGEPSGTGCKYTDVTLEGNLLTRSYEMTSNGITVRLWRNDVQAMSWSAQQNVLTWRTWALFGGLVFALVTLLLWPRSKTAQSSGSDLGVPNQ